MANILVIGAGMVGSAMAVNLAQDHQVINADFSLDALQRVKRRNAKVKTKQLDITDQSSVLALCKQNDLVILAVPGFLGFEALELIISAEKPIVDISFFPENALELDKLAKEHNVPVVVDCGVAPGMDNIILGHHDAQMKVEDFECLVGGLPKVRKAPFAYKAPFSPIDVIEEYTRPARLKENGHIVEKEALTDHEMLDFDNVGTLEAFNTDGLRSLLETMPHIDNMREKTLRYPGHIALIQSLKQAGFFDEEAIKVNGESLTPLDMTASMLLKDWKLKDDDAEFTIMRVTVTGKESGEDIQYVYDLFDEYCPQSKTSSMARTTGYTACAAAEMLLNGLITEPGILPPELIGKKEGVLEFALEYLKERDVFYKKSVQHSS